MITTNFTQHLFCVFFKIVKTCGLDQPTVDGGGVTRGRPVAVGCLHFNGTSTTLQLHFNGTSMALPKHFNSIYFFIFYETKIILLLLSVLVERFSVSRMRDSFSLHNNFLRFSGV